MARAALARGNTARAGVGVAGRKPNRLRGLSVEGEVPQPDHRGRNPSRHVQIDLIRQYQAQGEPSRKGRVGSPSPTSPPCPARLLPRGPCTITAAALDQPEHPMPDFNLAVLSLADLRDLQKSVAKAISTFEARQKAEAREKVEMLAKDLGFTLLARRASPPGQVVGRLRSRPRRRDRPVRAHRPRPPWGG